VNALLRHSTAALLNAADPNVDYFYSQAQIIFDDADRHQQRRRGPHLSPPRICSRPRTNWAPISARLPGGSTTTTTD